MDGEPDKSGAATSLTGKWEYSPTEEYKSIADIDACFGPTIREFLNVKELIPSLLQKRLIEQEVAKQLVKKLDTGQIQSGEACGEVFIILRRVEEEAENAKKESIAKGFIDCLKNGDIPENRILACFIEGTGSIPAHRKDEQQFRENFIANLQKCRDQMSGDGLVDALTGAIGHRNAREIMSRSHDGSIDRFLLLVFTLSRHPAKMRNPVIKFLMETGRKKLAGNLGSLKDQSKVDEDDVRTFEDGFSSLGYLGDSSGNVQETLDGPTQFLGVVGVPDTDGKEQAVGAAHREDGNQKVILDRAPDEHGQREAGTDSPEVGPNDESLSQSTEDHKDHQTEKGETGGGSENPEFYSSLRKYQVELAGPALKGKNSIIIAPTGTGKTHVAAYVINEHFRRLKKQERCPKVVFVVHTKVLADQQLKKLEELIGSEDKRISAAIGDKINIPLAQIMHVSNVVVLTAQILLNGLEEGLDQVKMGDLSLLIFDECHHCHKDHPFNKIMHEYHRVKRGLLEGKATANIIKTSLPQIIGMTASIGTGKSKSTEKAFEHIVKTCANLDTEEVQTVLDKEDLQKFLHIPDEIDPQIVPPKKEDKFKDVLERIMIDIEEKLRHAFKGRISKERVEGVPISCSGARDSQIYEAWVEKFKRDSVNITKEGNEQELVSSCLYNLSAYNRGLCLNRDVRMKDALNYLKETFNQRRPLKGPCNEELLRKFDETVPYLENVCRDDVGNPVLAKLREIIVMEFEQKPNSRALLFTPTVQSTKALQDWIIETEEFDNLKLNPGRVTGGSTELTDAERNNTVRKFRSGEHKLLVVTNVVEQGMDIAECNLVIRLNYIPSDTGHIQVKGRNRAKGGKSYLVASAGHGNFKNREMSNRIRESMMGRLLEILKEIPKEEFAGRVQKVQERDYRVRARAEQRDTEEETDTDDIEYILKCGHCRTMACNSRDVVSLKTYHTVDKMDFVKKKIEVERASADQAGFAVGIVRCRKCKNQWGTWVKFENLKFASIQIVNFIVTNTETDESFTRKQWKDAFKCREVEDLKPDLQKIYNTPASS